MINNKQSFKSFVKQIDDAEWSKWKKRTKRKNHGLKKGDGGLPEGGPEGSITAMASENMVSRVFSSKILINVIPEDEEINQQEEPSTDFKSTSNMSLDNEPSISSEEDFDELQDSQDPDKQGVLRFVKNAHLVYKRQNEDGKYNELWIFKNDSAVKNDIDIKNDILAGTDISSNKTRSEDGEQEYELWTAGNVQFLFITGMPQ